MLNSFFLKKYWFELFVIGYVVMATAMILILQKDKEVLISKLETCNTQLMAQNTLIMQNKADYDEALRKLPIVLTKINTKYKTTYETIYKWRDRNETDCNDSLAFINHFEF